MKLPRILSQQQIPSSVPGGEISGAAASAPARALQQGAGELGGSIAHTGGIFAAVERQKQLERENDEALGTYLGVTRKLSELDSRLKLGAVDPTTGERTRPAGEAEYVGQWEAGYAEIEKEALAGISNERVQFGVRRMLKGEQARHAVAARSYADQLFKDTKLGNLNTYTEELVAQAAADPDAARIPFWRGLHAGYIESNANWLPEVDRVKRTREFDEKVGIARARREILAGTFDAAKTSELVRDPIKLGTLIDHDLTVQDRRRSERRTEEERVRKETATAADKDVGDAVAGGDMPKALALLEENRRVFEGPRYEHWREKIKKGPVSETDPAVRRELMPDVYNVSGDARRTDDKLRKYFGQGKVADDDYQKWGGHLETRINRLQARAEGEANRAESRKDREAQRDEGRLKHEEGEAQQMLRELTRVTGPAAASLDTVAQDTLNWGLEDMARNSPLYPQGGNERPMAWVERNKAAIMARIGTVANNRLRAIDQTAAIKEPDTQGPTLQAAERARQRLLERRTDRTLFKSEADFYDQVRMIDEKVSLIRQLELYGKKPPTPGAGGQTPPRGVPSEPSLKPAGKTGGR